MNTAHAISQAQVIAHLKDGWELIESKHGGAAWMVRDEEAGEYRDVRNTALPALLKGGYVELYIETPRHRKYVRTRKPVPPSMSI